MWRSENIKWHLNYGSREIICVFLENSSERNRNYKLKIQLFNHYQKQNQKKPPCIEWGHRLWMIKIDDALHFTPLLIFIPAWGFCAINWNFQTESVNPFLFRNANGINVTMTMIFLHFHNFS